MSLSLKEIIAEINDFASAREWDQFHTPKNLASSIVIEAGELLECVQWDNPSCEELISDKDRITQIGEEIADVLNYSLRLCSLLNLNPLEELEKKLVKNESKYPVSSSKGTSQKYTTFEREGK